MFTASLDGGLGPSNRIDLGSFASCSGAVAAAQRYYSQSNGCYYCARACHTS